MDESYHVPQNSQPRRRKTFPPAKPGYKYCTACELELILDQFHLFKGKPKGECIACERARDRARWPERYTRKKPIKPEVTKEGYKVCNTCFHEKALDEFNENAQQKDGHAGRCRQCEHDKHANRTEEEIEQDRTKRKASEDTRREQIRAYDRERGKLSHRKADNSARQKAKLAEARAQRELELQLNPPPPKLTKICPKCDPPVEKPLSEFYERKGSKDGHGSYCKECIAKDSHNRLDKRREREQAKSPEQKREKYDKHKEWRRTSPTAKLSMNETVMRRRARKKQAKVGRVSYKRILARDGYICYLCGQPVAPDDIHFDHVIPLSRGGPHSEDNIRVAHSACNRRKAASLPPRDIHL